MYGFWSPLLQQYIFNILILIEIAKLQRTYAMRRHPFAFLLAAALPVSILAAPSAKITVDTADYNAGTVIEGQMSSVKHTFVIKNTGDSVLKILNVRPG
jgi:hypothetical protein